MTGRHQRLNAVLACLQLLGLVSAQASGSNMVPLGGQSVAVICPNGNYMEFSSRNGQNTMSCSGSADTDVGPFNMANNFNVNSGGDGSAAALTTGGAYYMNVQGHAATEFITATPYQRPNDVGNYTLVTSSYGGSDGSGFHNCECALNFYIQPDGRYKIQAIANNGKYMTDAMPIINGPDVGYWQVQPDDTIFTPNVVNYEDADIFAIVLAPSSSVQQSFAEIDNLDTLGNFSIQNSVTKNYWEYSSGRYSPTASKESASVFHIANSTLHPGLNGLYDITNRQFVSIPSSSEPVTGSVSEIARQTELLVIPTGQNSYVLWTQANPGAYLTYDPSTESILPSGSAPEVNLFVTPTSNSETTSTTNSESTAILPESMTSESSPSSTEASTTTSSTGSTSENYDSTTSEGSRSSDQTVVTTVPIESTSAPAGALSSRDMSISAETATTDGAVTSAEQFGATSTHEVVTTELTSELKSASNSEGGVKTPASEIAATTLESSITTSDSTAIATATPVGSHPTTSLNAPTTATDDESTSSATAVLSEHSGLKGTSSALLNISSITLDSRSSLSTTSSENEADQISRTILNTVDVSSLTRSISLSTVSSTTTATRAKSNVQSIHSGMTLAESSTLRTIILQSSSSSLVLVSASESSIAAASKTAAAMPDREQSSTNLSPYSFSVVVHSQTTTGTASFSERTIGPSPTSNVEATVNLIGEDEQGAKWLFYVADDGTIRIEGLDTQPSGQGKSSSIYVLSSETELRDAWSRILSFDISSASNGGTRIVALPMDSLNLAPYGNKTDGDQSHFAKDAFLYTAANGGSITVPGFYLYITRDNVLGIYAQNDAPPQDVLYLLSTLITPLAAVCLQDGTNCTSKSDPNTTRSSTTEAHIRSTNGIESTFTSTMYGESSSFTTIPRRPVADTSGRIHSATVSDQELGMITSSQVSKPTFVADQEGHHGTTSGLTNVATTDMNPDRTSQPPTGVTDLPSSECTASNIEKCTEPGTVVTPTEPLQVADGTTGENDTEPSDGATVSFAPSTSSTLHVNSAPSTDNSSLPTEVQGGEIESTITDASDRAAVAADDDNPTSNSTNSGNPTSIAEVTPSAPEDDDPAVGTTGSDSPASTTEVTPSTTDFQSNSSGDSDQSSASTSAPAFSTLVSGPSSSSQTSLPRVSEVPSSSSNAVKTSVFGLVAGLAVLASFV